MTGPDTLPPEEEEIPDTDPAPMVLRLPAPSMPAWPEETPTAVQCPHPPGESR